jgi:succinate dehydrogenase/fumarate reductase flavoprotein subunit
MIDITIRQSNPNCLVYYTITVGDWIYDGDALDINAALTMIQHNLQHNCPENK